MTDHLPIDDLRPRAADRIRVDFDAFLRFDRHPELPVFIRDLSSRGFRCRCRERLAIGSRVILRVPKVGQFPATIAWQLGADAGARFDSALPLQTVMRIVLAVVKAEQVETEPANETGEARPEAREPARKRSAAR